MAKTFSPFDSDVQNVTDQVKEMVGKFKVPGVDAQAMVEQQRKNLDAMVEAMHLTNKGAHTVAERQLQLFHKTSTQLISLYSQEKLTPEERADLAKKAFETALAGSRELYDITLKASEQAFAIARQRVTEGVEEYRKSLGQKADGK